MMKQRPLFWAACLLLLAACGQAGKSPKSSVTLKLPAAGVPVPPDSSYTSLERASCQIAKSVRHCEGSAGYSLEASRQSVTIITPDGRRSELDLSKVTKGSSPRLGTKAEWRGAVPGHPTALIIRVNHDLAVARLDYPACIVAVVAPQAGQNDKAREIADEKLPACLRG